MSGKPRTICPTFWIGDHVYLVVDEDKEVGIITRITMLPCDLYVFVISWGGEDSSHYDFELEKVAVEKEPA